MKIKLLLVFLFFSIGILKAQQDTIRTLIISEARIDQEHAAYIELTNVGTTTIDLSKFELGKIGPWTTPYIPDANNWFMLPNKMLAPGKSFVIAKTTDWDHKMWARDPLKFANPFNTKPEMLKLADVGLNIAEAPNQPDPLDSVTPYFHTLELWGGSYCIYLRHHVAPNDSVIVDKVNGIWGGKQYSAQDVAGVYQATVNDILIRKANVTKGDTDFNAGRGTSLAESEWMAVPFLSGGGWEPGRAVFWTVGNHGDYHLSSLTSTTMQINWTDSTLTVPWGVRNDDSIMYQFTRVPGIAWHYDYAGSHADSAYVSVRTGDVLTVYACGNTLEKIKFKINLLAPTSADNIVMPKKPQDSHGFYIGQNAYCIVTDKAPGMDTIMNIPFGCRVDTLLKYLEKPPKATWSVVFVDGLTRVDLKTGDILKVTAENGTSIKQYFIKPNKYWPSHNAYLSYITWPDIPVGYKGFFGWKGDTIPNFSSSKLAYQVQVPIDVAGIPALTAKTQDMNAKYKLGRAVSLTGTDAEKTVTVTATAQDDTSKLVYSVELVKEKDKADMQPWSGEPFISQFVFKQDYNNYFLEVVNPGTTPLDLSNYMFTFGVYSSPAEAITRVSTVADSANRYNKYIPGYKWDRTHWASTPARVIPDQSINTIVQPGDVFVLADVGEGPNTNGYPAFMINQVDIDFGHNPWGEDLSSWAQAMNHWMNAKYMIFKILNDTVKMGLKPANDPNDFKLIDMWGDAVGSQWDVGGNLADQCYGWTRKPNIGKGNTVFGKSFGTDEQNSEWTMVNESRTRAQGYGWPQWREMIADGIGSHFMNTVTIGKSTVESSTYIISPGYSQKETIKGLVAGTTVTDFLKNIAKADTGQHLKLKKGTDGSILTGSDAVSIGDTLIVVSSDSVNVSKYIMDPQVLSNDARLVSARYTITINESAGTGTITDFPYGTRLDTVIAYITVPNNATFVAIDTSDQYVPLKKLTFDTTYVDVQVNDNIYFEVTAENRTTKIKYHLQPTVKTSDALVTSDVYHVDQEASLIDYIPNGTSVPGFFSNVIPCTGATIQLIDKYGLVRQDGLVVRDDKLVVTAEDKVTTKTYYLSMLGTKAHYLAYVLSTVYTIDQIHYKITGHLSKTKVSSFINNLVPAEGATIKVVNQQGVENNDTLKVGDELIVTSGDSLTVISYSIDMLTSVQNLSTVGIEVYPNPTADKVYVTGLNTGDRICVYNSVGARIVDMIAGQDRELVSLQNKSTGIYIIIVSNGKEVLGRFKLNVIK